MFGWSEINVETVAGLTSITDIFPVRAAGEIAALAGLVAQRTSTAKLNAKDRVITFHNKQFRDFTKDLLVDVLMVGRPGRAIPSKCPC
jgi:hypothetical protein